MKIKGIRIFGDINNDISVNLLDILEEVQNAATLYWSILFLEAIGHLGEGKSLLAFEKQIDESKKGFLINWEDLNILAKKF